MAIDLNNPIRVRNRKVSLRKQISRELRKLKICYNVEVSLKWSHGRRFGLYNPRKKVILLGPKVTDPLAALTHQFTHTLIHTNHVTKQSHNFQFCQTLWQIVLFVYDDPRDYPWLEEPFSYVFEYGRNRTKNWLSERNL